jgi:hypothetical protein
MNKRNGMTDYTITLRCKMIDTVYPNPAEPEPNIAYRLAKLSDGSGSAGLFAS